VKILIINPNSSLGMTAAIQKSADNFSKGEFQVICKPTDGGPEFIDTYEDRIKAAPGMMKMIRENEKDYDAFIVACHCDPNLDLLKEITTKPVVGIGEASMKIATMLGHSFSVVSTGKNSIPNKEALIKKYGLQDSAASVRAPEDETCCCSEEEKFIQASKLAIEKDMAEVIVLGCAGISGLDKSIGNKFGVPVLDGVICALIIAVGLVKAGLSTSKIRRYNPEY